MRVEKKEEEEFEGGLGSIYSPGAVRGDGRILDDEGESSLE